MSRETVQSPVSPLSQGDIPRLHLPWDSRFSTSTIRSHLGEHPGLAFWNPVTGEYAVGGRWRGRRDIGMIVEASKGPSQALLVKRLVSRFREEGFRAAVLSQDGAERAAKWYLEHGWSLLDRLLVFRLGLSRIQVEREDIPLLSSFRPPDLESLTELDRVAFPWLWWNEPADFLSYSSSPNVAAFVARREGRLIGYISYTTRNGRGHLDRLAVHPSFQRRGYGSRLLTSALRRMRESGVREAGLTTQEANLAAQGLYKRLGFVKTGEVHEVYGLELSHSSPHTCRLKSTPCRLKSLTSTQY